MSAEQANEGTTAAAASTGAPVLSEDEKARIRHEMSFREEIRRELAKPKPTESRRWGVHPFLNSPFFLTANRKEIKICYEFLQYLAEGFIKVYDNDDEADEAINKAITFFFHELGHALADIDDLPTVGRGGAFDSS